MKKTSWMIGLAVVALAVMAGGAVADDEKKKDEKTANPLAERGGFRNVRLGISLDDFRALDAKASVKRSRTKEDVVFYTRSNDKLSLFETRVSSIEYAFKGDRLVAIIILTEPVTGRDRELTGDSWVEDAAEIVAITAGYTELMQGAEVELDDTQQKRIEAHCKLTYRAEKVALSWTFGSESIALLVLPMRLESPHLGETTTRTAVIYVEKGFGLDEI